MDFVNEWNGYAACTLQSTLRMSNEAFAKHLDVQVRTVAGWHQRPETTPRGETQQLLDIALERASKTEKARFFQKLGKNTETTETSSDDVQALKVSIAIVVRDDKVLLVCRRGEDGKGINWQFPAGMVKPGVRPETVAARETFGETGVHCSPLHQLGSRLHPITHVFCEYWLCEYLTGDAENLDVVENVSVVWADKRELTRFIPADQIFPPILEALEATSE